MVFTPVLAVDGKSDMLTFTMLSVAGTGLAPDREQLICGLA